MQTSFGVSGLLLALGALLTLFTVVACAAPQSPEQRQVGVQLSHPRGLEELDYTFALRPDLSALSAEVCMHGRLPDALVYGHRASMDFLRDARITRPAPTRALRVEHGRIVMPELPSGACVAYEVDIHTALERDSLLLAYGDAQAVTTSVELFLWRPAVRPSGMRARARFILPDGMRVSVPWPKTASDSDTYEIPASAFAFTGHAAFGHLDADEIEHSRTRATLVTLPGFALDTRAPLVDWLSSALDVVTISTGRFPVPHVQLVAVPTAASPWPIQFGHTGRGGGVSILVFLPSNLRRDDLQRDWIAIHELSHLYLPFIQREDAWLSEGMATYLQEVLRARSGLLTASDVWRRLYEGAKLGEAAEGDLRHETRIMPIAANYQRVYWAGAVIALRIDVELRRSSEGKVTLDQLLAELEPEGPRSLRPASAEAVLARLDALAGSDVPSRVARAALEDPRLPSLDALYRELGLRADGQPAAEPAPLAWVRDAIMPSAADPAWLPLFRR